MNATSATSRRSTAGWARWPAGSALLLIVVLGGIGGTMPRVGAQAGTAVQACSAMAKAHRSRVRGPDA